QLSILARLDQIVESLDHRRFWGRGHLSCPRMEFRQTKGYRAANHIPVARFPWHDDRMDAGGAAVGMAHRSRSAEAHPGGLRHKGCCSILRRDEPGKRRDEPAR